jgi:arginase
MKIQIIQVPYDCGYKNVRQGRAPEYFLKNNLVRLLEEDGHRVDVAAIEAQSEFTLEIGTAFELNRLLSPAVSGAIAAGKLPLVLAGNCNSCLGSIAGIDPDRLGVVWFDAHGEFNTPETTLSGFLDGMPLAIATGRCWKAVARTIPGFAAVKDSNVILAGACDLDKEEQRQLINSKIKLISSANRGDGEILEAFEAALADLADNVRGVYLHIDMDAFEITRGRANHYGATGGLSVELVEAAIAAVKARFKIMAAAVASFDPAGDTHGLFLQAGLRCIRRIAA